MGFTGNLVDHPAQFSDEILVEITPILDGYRDLYPLIFDPFAGLGHRLGELCDQLGLAFAGCDIEDWPTRDRHVHQADCRDAAAYPPTPFAICTSPPYFGNRISSDYVDGPLETTKLNGRRSYGTSLGRALHAENLARICKKGNADHEIAFYTALVKAATHWGDLAIFNVDLPMQRYSTLALERVGYEIVDVRPVETRRYRGGAGSAKRAEHEVVIVGAK